MIRNIKRLLPLLLALALPAHAQYMSGNDLLERLNDNDSAVKRSVALGYILGVADGLDGQEVCVQRSVQAGQVRDVVHQWLRDNPALRHLPAAAIVAGSLSRVWPCQTGKKL